MEDRFLILVTTFIFFASLQDNSLFKINIFVLLLALKSVIYNVFSMKKFGYPLG